MTGNQEKRRKAMRLVRGQVVSNKMNKTIVVELKRKVRHPLYEKFVTMRTKLYAHDEKGEAMPGDSVEIAATRPLSKLKRWRLVRVVHRAAQV
ncbi:MAG: 30S ribosomal protein S17 [Planctomycetota bacterium]